jgi:hypothetical protein
VSLLLSLTIVLNIGLSLNVHYCGGSPVGISLFAADATCCDLAEEGAMSCCEDVVLEIDLETSYTSSFFSPHLADVKWVTLPPSYTCVHPDILFLDQQSETNASDLFTSTIPIYQRNRCFRI